LKLKYHAAEAGGISVVTQCVSRGGIDRIGLCARET
jgi:hypothetical protein